MPVYQQIIVALPHYSKTALADLFKKYSSTILSSKGVIRGIENHGIRPLPEKAKRKYPTVDGKRYFWEARFVTCTFDSSPLGLVEIDRMLKTEEGVLRYYTIKLKSKIDFALNNSFRNPYL